MPGDVSVGRNHLITESFVDAVVFYEDDPFAVKRLIELVDDCLKKTLALLPVENPRADDGRHSTTSYLVDDVPNITLHFI